jgi:TatD DNase family protein
MIDTHAHIYAVDFQADRDAMLQRAKTAGIKQVLLPNVDVSSIKALKCMVGHHEGISIKPMMGLHPCSVGDDYKNQLQVIKEELYKGGCIAVGEIGMDLYWDNTMEDKQRDAFITQCMWATQLGLPIAIHSRDATQKIIDILIEYKKSKNLTGVFHCFGGSAAEAIQILDLGFYLGIGGVLSFKNSTLGDTLKTVPLERIVLETDAPYLAPTPYRGKRNEPAYLIEVVKHLTYVYACTEEEVIRTTSQNAIKLFGI